MLSRWPNHFLRIDATLPKDKVEEQVRYYTEKTIIGIRS